MEKSCKSERSGDDGGEDADDNRESVSEILENMESVLPVCTSSKLSETLFARVCRLNKCS